MATPDPGRFRAYLEREIAQTRLVAAKQRAMRNTLEAVLRHMNIGNLRELEAWVRRNSRRRPPAWLLRRSNRRAGPSRWLEGPRYRWTSIRS